MTSELCPASVAAGDFRVRSQAIKVLAFVPTSVLPSGEKTRLVSDFKPVSAAILSRVSGLIT